MIKGAWSTGGQYSGNGLNMVNMVEIVNMVNVINMVEMVNMVNISFSFSYSIS